MRTAIYRTGQMTIAEHEEYILQHWFAFDEFRPKGQVSRHDALFAAPNLEGGHHWLMSRLSHSVSRVFNEIIVESDNVRVYSVEDYNMVGDHYGNPTDEQLESIKAYWDTSMTLTEWITEVGHDPYGQWEVLLPPSEVISSRTLSRSDMEKLYTEHDMDEALEDLDYLFYLMEPNND